MVASGLAVSATVGIGGGSAGIALGAAAAPTRCAPGHPAGGESGWWAWRGPCGNNVAATAEFAAGGITPGRVAWETAVPGRGHSSPIVTDRAIYLTTADTAAGTQSVLAFDRQSGKSLWADVVHRGGLPRENHPKNTEATPTVAFDGRRIIATFYNDDAIRATAYSTDGKRLWQKSVSRYSPQRFKYGYAASPTLYGDTVIFASEYDGPSFLTALSLETGETVWQADRPNSPSFSSPIIARIAGRDQLLISGSRMVVSYDPRDGSEMWQAAATATATCGTLVWDDQNVYASGGFPESETACVRADGSATLVWKNNQKCYEQSMLCFDGHVYAVTDQGVAYCWRTSDGEMMWRQRLGGDYSCSPILVGDVIYAFNEAGQTFAIQATPDRFVDLGTGKIGDEVFASPAIVGDTMYHRVARGMGNDRQEFLLAIR
jgi:outer membrane protein assembly factor BamB